MAAVSSPSPRRSMTIAAAAIALPLAALLGLTVMAATLWSQSCGGGGGATLSGPGTNPMPADLRAAYNQVAQESGVPAAILAGTGDIESKHADAGRNYRMVSSAGALGPMQFLPATFAGLGCGTGEDIYRPLPAVRCAAKYLIELSRESASPGPSNPKAMWQYAMCRYNGGCRAGVSAEAGYGAAGQVAIATAVAYGYTPGQEGQLSDQGAGDAGNSCPADSLLVDSGQTGPVRFAAGANRPGVEPTDLLKRALGRVAGIYGRPIIVTTGTNHNQYTTSGNISDHWSGNAADIGAAANNFPITGLGRPGGNGDKIAAAGMIAAGVSPARAAVQALAGGLCNIVHGGLRWQVIWKTNSPSLGGDHTNHVHIGVRPQAGDVPMSCVR